MKNLNEPRKPSNEDVIPFERRAAVQKETKTRPDIPARQMDDLRGRWNTIQSSFVDEPRKAVEQADELIASAIQQIEEDLNAERANLKQEWSRGDQVSTEDLRISLQHYREYFDRLISRT
jgi:hypothetical protein